MSRLGVTYQQVETAAEKIVTGGENPTIERVRRILGGTGSNTTISKYLNDWRMTHLKGATEESISIRPQSDPVNAAVNQIWQELRHEAQSEIQRMQKIVEKSQEERDNLLQELEHLRQEHSAAKQQIINLNSALNSEQQQHRLSQEQAKNYQKTLELFQEETKQRIQELEAVHTKQLNHHEEQTKWLIQQHKEETDQLKEASETQRHRLIVEADYLKTHCHKLEKIVEQNKMMQQQAESRCTELMHDKEALLKQLAVIQSDYQTLNRQQTSTEKELAILQAEARQLSLRLQDYQQAATAAQQIQQELKERVIQLENQLQDNQAALTRMTDEFLSRRKK